MFLQLFLLVTHPIQKNLFSSQENILYLNTEPQVIVNPDFQIKLTYEWDLNGRHLLACLLNGSYK